MTEGKRTASDIKALAVDVAGELPSLVSPRAKLTGSRLPQTTSVPSVVSLKLVVYCSSMVETSKQPLAPSSKELPSPKLSVL